MNWNIVISKFAFDDGLFKRWNYDNLISVYVKYSVGFFFKFLVIDI